MKEITLACRQLAKSPGFAAVALISLALGIGANTAIFSLVNAILLRSLPVPNPHELRVLNWSGVDPKLSSFTGSQRRGGESGNYRSGGIQAAGGQRMTADSFTFPLYRALRETAASQAEVFAYAHVHDVTVRSREEPFTANGLMVTDNFFAGLGVRPVLGRLFLTDEHAAGASRTIVITHGWWEKYFGSGSEVLDATVSLNGQPYSVVGVLPREFKGVSNGDGVEFYVTLAAHAHLLPSWPTESAEHWWVKLMARLQPRANDASLAAALDVTFARQTEKNMKAGRIELGDGRAGPEWSRSYYQKPLLLLLGVVGVVILVACANVAGLSLARAAARQHEFAVRSALGAGRWRLMRQSLVENSVLALGGAALGLLLGWWGQTALGRLLLGGEEGLRYDVALDVKVLGFTVVLACLAAVLSGVLPAWRAGRVDPLLELKSAGALAVPRLHAGRVLVVLQIALSLLLVAGAGLYVRTLLNLVRIDPGFTTDNVLLFRVNPRTAGHRGAAVVSFHERVHQSLARVPGVAAVTLVQFPLLGGSMSGGSFFTLPAHPDSSGSKPQAHRLTVGESYFETMRVALQLGRGFTASDTDGAPKVVVVNETFTRKHLANEHPIGQVLKVGNVEWKIVGVCQDTKYTGLREAIPPTVYFTYRQSSPGAAYFAVRSTVPPLSLVPAARRAVAALDPNVPISHISTQSQLRANVVGQERMFALLVSALAGLAVLLSCIGLYGLMAYHVTRRTGEIGVRMALGATPGRIARPILRDALMLATYGAAVGVPAALALAHGVKAQLYGVAPSDPLTLIFGVLLLGGVALLAAWLPARRAARVDPMEALRTD